MGRTAIILVLFILLVIVLEFTGRNNNTSTVI